MRHKCGTDVRFSDEIYQQRCLRTQGSVRVYGRACVSVNINNNNLLMTPLLCLQSLSNNFLSPWYRKRYDPLYISTACDIAVNGI